MPVHIEARGGKHCVVEPGGETVACHDDRDDALAQLRAINANTEKGYYVKATDGGYAVGIGDQVASPTYDLASDAWLALEGVTVTDKQSTTISTDEDGTTSDQTKMGGHYVEESAPGEEAYYAYPPATSFDDLEAAEHAREAAKQTKNLTDKLCAIVETILSDPDVAAKTTMIRQASEQFVDRVEAAFGEDVDPARAKETNATARRLRDAVDALDTPRDEVIGELAQQAGMTAAAVRAALSGDAELLTEAQLASFAEVLQVDATSLKKATPLTVAEVETAIKEGPEALEETGGDAFFVWKDAAAGTMRWLGVFSNNVRDRDDPPEILTASAHKSFVAAVEAGLVDYPELWHWHVPGTRWGKADWLTYADAGKGVGFMLASGTVDPGHEAEARTIAKQLAAGDDVRMSHGMPGVSIVRSTDDPTHIEFYVSKEISDLPGDAAANALTRFTVLTKEDTMAVLDETKKQYLLEVGLTDDQVARVEEGLAGAAKQVDEAGLERKAAETDDETPPETKADEADGDEDEGEDDGMKDAGLSEKAREEVAEGILAAFEPLAEQVKAVVAQTEAKDAKIADLEAELAALKADDETKVAEKAANVPAASIAAILAQKFSAVGADTTRVKDGELADRPKETDVPTARAGQTGIPFIDSLVSGEYDRKAREATQQQ